MVRGVARREVDRAADDPGAARRAARPARRAPSARCSSAARSRARSSTAAPSPRSPRRARRRRPSSLGLVRKELVRPDRRTLPGDDAFRFRHLLIRDAAYDALPKATRAELHERFADWLEERGAELVELDEILGYHLEQAARYRLSSASPPAGSQERAAVRLAAAGVRAAGRRDAARRRTPRRADALLEPGDPASPRDPAEPRSRPVRARRARRGVPHARRGHRGRRRTSPRSHFSSSLRAGSRRVDLAVRAGAGARERLEPVGSMASDARSRPAL